MVNNFVTVLETVSGLQYIVCEIQLIFIFQDEPLPHELRPTHVLAMTMDYLVTMVINNRSAEGSGEWFNFIWNRTRAIRKVSEFIFNA